MKKYESGLDEGHLNKTSNAWRTKHSWKVLGIHVNFESLYHIK